jgi:hypothetical protein
MRRATEIIRIEAGNTSIDHSNLPCASTTTRAKMTINTTMTTSASVALSCPTPPTFIQGGSRPP